ncbi:MAG: TIM barrel protein [Chloroflexota bacterium]
MSIYASSGCFPTKSPHELIRLADAWGITHIELSSSMRYAEDFLQPIQAVAHRFTFLVHNYFPPPQDPFVLNLASAQKTQLEKSKAMVKAGIDLSVAFGAPFYSVHAGFGIDLRPEDLGKPHLQAKIPADRIVPRAIAYEILCETISELAVYAEDNGIMLLLENNVVTDVNIVATPDDMLWMASPDEFIQVLDEVNNPQLGILLDVAHLKVAAQALRLDLDDALKVYQPHTYCLHLSDNDGRRDTNQIVQKDSWFMSTLCEFTKMPTVIESYNLSQNQLHQQINLVKDVFND